MKKLFFTLIASSMAMPSEAVTFTPLASNLRLDQPVFLLADPSPPSRGVESFWVLEKSGKVQGVLVRRNTAQVRTLLDLSSVKGFTDSGEQGLLGAAVDPNYATHPFLYLYQSFDSSKADPAQASLIVRYRWNVQLQAFDPASRAVLLTIPQPGYSNHKAGMIAFGPDKHLYIATGDGGSGGDPHNHGQNKNSLLGKILRVAIAAGELSVPRDNPFAGDASSRAEIWAYGLRNLWRFSFDRRNGDLWAGDVGQNRYEEIDLITKGGNYGWRLWEGETRFSDQALAAKAEFKKPVYVYGRSQGYSVTGGYVYRGTRLAALRGRYIFGDYGSGTVWSLTPAPAGRTPSVARIGKVDSLVSFAEDAAGELLAIGMGGEIFRLR